MLIPFSPFLCFRPVRVRVLSLRACVWEGRVCVRAVRLLPGSQQGGMWHWRRHLPVPLRAAPHGLRPRPTHRHRPLGKTVPARHHRQERYVQGDDTSPGGYFITNAVCVGCERPSWPVAKGVGSYPPIWTTPSWKETKQKNGKQSMPPPPTHTHTLMKYQLIKNETSFNKK